MSYLNRLHTKYETIAVNKRQAKKNAGKGKGGKAPIGNSLKKAEEAEPMDISKKAEPKTDAPMDVSKKAPEPSAPTDPKKTSKNKNKRIVNIGKSYHEEGRFSAIRSYHPFLFVIAARNQELISFTTSVSSILNNKKAVELLLEGVANSAVEEDGAFAWLVAKQDIKALENAAKQANIPFLQEDFSEKIRASRPFDKVNWGFGNFSDSTSLINRLQKSLDALKESNGLSAERGISALQVGSGIPLNYTRFLNTQNKKYKIHLGGRPSGAGQVGRAYFLCDKAEYNNFVEWMVDFNPPSSFDDDVYFPNNLDIAFKQVAPADFLPAPCIILEHTNKFTPTEVLKLKDFDPDRPPTNPEDLVIWNVAKAVGFNKKESNLKIVNLDLINTFVNDKINKTKLGGYHSNSFLIGNVGVHFSADFKKVILWGETGKKISVSEQEVKDSFEQVAISIKSVDLTYAG